MILAATRPELFGPIILAGSPLSYWAGVRGKYPMRYSGGLLGGTWLTALASDIGGGKFDGGYLVRNFENQNPANTLWTKQHNVYSKIDTEPSRYLRWAFGRLDHALRARTWDDIRATGGNSPEDERRFAAAARVSEINLSLYRAFVQPMIKSIFTPQLASWLRRWNRPAAIYVVQRLYSLDEGGGERRRTSSRAPLRVSRQSVPRAAGADLGADHPITGRLARQDGEAFRGRVPHDVGSPVLQAAVGIDPNEARPRKPGKSLLHRELLRTRIAELKSHIDKGGLQECVIRGLLYVGMTRGKVDERGTHALRQVRLNEGASRLTVSEFKAMAREQFLLLLLDPEETLAAIPKMLPASVDERQRGLAAIRKVLSASGAISDEAARRMKQVAMLFETSEAPPLSDPTSIPFSSAERAKAS